METKNTFCPHCRSSFETPVLSEGQEVQCPFCGEFFTVTILQDPAQPEELAGETPWEYQAEPFPFHSLPSEPSAAALSNEEPVKIAEKEKPSRPFSRETLLLWLTGGCVSLLLSLNVLLGISLFAQQTNVGNLEKQIRDL